MNELSFQRRLFVGILVIVFILFAAAWTPAQALSVVSTNPPSGAVGVRPDLEGIFITFDKPMMWPNLIPSNRCFSISSNWGTPYIIKAPWHPDNIVRIGREGGDFGFVNRTNLPPGAAISLTLNPPGAATDCFRDQEGNTLPTFNLSFTVRQNPGDPPVEPQVVSTNPPNGSTGVISNISSVSITFSKPMDITARTYIHRYGWGEFSGRWSDDKKTLTLTRTNAGTPLPDGEDIVFILSTDESNPFRDMDGNALQEYTFSFTISGDFKKWIENTYGVEIIQVPADPGKGFYWHYYLSIPKAPPETSVLYVAPNNTGWPAVDHTFHDIRARRTLYWQTGNVFNWRLDAPVLVPTFPRYAGHYLQNLWLDPLSENNRIVELRRIDLQLTAMIEDAKERLRAMGYALYDNVFMHGFSASGHFTARFTLIHPEIIRAAAFGPGTSTFPVSEWQGRELKWPEGISDIRAVAGKPFNSAAYRTVPKFIFIGDKEYGFDPDVWEMVEQIYNSVAANAEFKVYAGVGHHYSDEILSDLGKFFAQNKFPRMVELLSVTKAGAGNGTVTGSPPGIHCGDDCFELFPQGTQVSLTAAPHDGSTFAGWSGGGCSGTGSCELTMNSTKSVTATFTKTGKPIISASPMSVNLGSVKAGGISAPRMVAVKNTGLSDLVINSIEIRDPITGEFSSEFSQINNCTTAPIVKGLPPCNITVLFAPAIPFGKKNALMKIESNDPKKPAIAVKLSGTAPPPKISVAPKAVNFGPVSAGSAFVKTVTVKNNGISDLVIDSINITGTDASDFSQTSDCTAAPVQTGINCIISVEFKPASMGKKTAMISITSNDPKKPTVSVSLSGN